MYLLLPLHMNSGQLCLILKLLLFGIFLIFVFGLHSFVFETITWAIPCIYSVEHLIQHKMQAPKKSQISISHNNLPFRPDWFNYSRNHASLLYFAEQHLPRIAGAAHLTGCGSIRESSSIMVPRRGTAREAASIKKVTQKTLPLKELPKIKHTKAISRGSDGDKLGWS